MGIFSNFMNKKETTEQKNINYYNLKNKQEREIAFKNVNFSLTYRIYDNNYLLPLIINDEGMSSTTEILKRLNNVVVVIWNDDLYDNHTYLHFLIRLSQITKNPFPLKVTNVKDDYLLTEEGKEFSFSFESNKKKYEVELKKGLYLDYNFLKPIIEATEESQSGGSFYLIDDERLNSGFCFIYLDNEEYQSIINENLIRITKLTKEIVDEINIWMK